MAQEMMLEDFPFESDEAEDWETDESFAESDESAEDIGERARRRRNRFQPAARNVRGVRGVRLRGPNGVQNVPFPSKLATVAETKRGLGTLEGRLDRIESRVRGQQRNDSSVAGIVTLLLGGGLSVWGAVVASRESSGFTFGHWAKQLPSQMAAMTSVSQIATSGAKLAIHRQYPKSGLGIAADAFAVAQIAAFAFGSLYKPENIKFVADEAAIGNNPVPGTVYVTEDKRQFRVLVDSVTGKSLAVLVT